MRRVLVTGGSGFVGTNAVEYYARQGVPVLSLDVRAPVSSAHHRYWQRVDILDSKALESAVRSFAPTDVVHLAARTDLDFAA